MTPAVPLLKRPAGFLVLAQRLVPQPWHEPELRLQSRRDML
jgi:hypothetical protein